MEIIQDSPYMMFDREKWASFRDSEPLTLSETDLNAIKGIDEQLSLDEVEKIYLPLTRLLGYYIDENIGRQSVLRKFLCRNDHKTPFIISIAGSVSVGKSTTARLLQNLLSRCSQQTKVDLVTTDGFLYPNRVLQEKDLMQKKGFPQSYDIKRLIDFLRNIKAGKQNIEIPIYSHLTYDIVPNEYKNISRPDILIIEGLNVLQSGMDYPADKPRIFVSDFVDFSIYVDAEEDDLEAWYISRFLKFRKGAFEDPDSYFKSYAQLPENEAVKIAKKIWKSINLVNLRKNILPTRERANLILHKDESHLVDYVQLRK